MKLNSSTSGSKFWIQVTEFKNPQKKAQTMWASKSEDDRVKHDGKDEIRDKPVSPKMLNKKSIAPHLLNRFNSAKKKNSKNYGDEDQSESDIE